MVQHTLDQPYTTEFDIDEVDSQWVVTRAGSVITNNEWNSSFDFSYMADNAQLIVNGLVSSTKVAIEAANDGKRIVIGKHGAVSGYFGIHSSSGDSTVINHGRIDAGNTAIVALFDDFTLKNYGVISGNAGVSTSSPGEYHNYKGAIIQGNEPLSFDMANNGGAYVNFTNDGLIKKTGDDGKPAFNGGDESDYLVNNGRIEGSVVLDHAKDIYFGSGTLVGTLDGGLADDTLTIRNGHVGPKGGPIDAVVMGGSGNDTIDARGATIVHGYINGDDGNDTIDVRNAHLTTKVVFGGTGNDTLIVSSADVIFGEVSDGGIDRVKSTVSYTLKNQFVENLSLIGKKDANATGNDAGNHLKGNSGDNVLIGGAGADILDGGKGDDKLFGGAGDDTFRFATGYGKDVVNFQNGDSIDIANWKAIDNLGRVKSHAEDHGADVWIVAGDDTLVITHMHSADLHAGDFQF
jgi:Ca2+-binding RTX toxin-like protein